MSHPGDRVLFRFPFTLKHHTSLVESAPRTRHHVNSMLNSTWKRCGRAMSFRTSIYRLQGVIRTGSRTLLSQSSETSPSRVPREQGLGGVGEKFCLQNLSNGVDTNTKANYHWYRLPLRSRQGCWRYGPEKGVTLDLTSA